MTREESMSITAKIGEYIADKAPKIRYTLDELASAKEEFTPEDLEEMAELGLYDGDFEKFYVIREFLSSIGLGDVADGDYILKVFQHAERLDAAEFVGNPYMTILQGLPARSGKFVLMPSQYERGEIFLWGPPDLQEELILPRLAFFSKRVLFPTLYEEELPWMSICPSEISSMRKEAEAAHGRVLVLGLGLGYYAWDIAKKATVESVTVVELSHDVITLFREHIEPKLDFQKKLTIIEGDAVGYLETLTGSEYDFCFADIWEGAVDGAKWYQKIRPHDIRLKDTDFTYWIEEAILAYLSDK